MSFLADIIQTQVIDKLPTIIEVTSIDDKILSVGNTYFLREGSVIKDSNDVEFIVVEFVNGVSITVNNSGFVGNITVKKPEFMWGTQMAVDDEYGMKSVNSEYKLPMIWLLEPWQETSYPRSSSKDYRAQCRFFFLDTNNPDDLNEDIKTNSQAPMFNLSDIFIKTINRNSEYFNNVDDWTKQPLTRFGTNEEGRPINDDLTGCELTLSVDVNKASEGCGLRPSVPPISPCADGVANVLNSLGNLVDTFNVPSSGVGVGLAPDAIATVKDQLGNFISSTSIPSNVNQDIVVNVGGVCADGTVINSDGTYTLAVPSGSTVLLPDTNYIVNYGGTTTNFSVPTLGDNTITLNYI